MSEEASVGISDPGGEPERSGRAVVGSYTLCRGRKVYELKNHPSALLRTCLGNVLAVVSDVKLGVSTANYSPAPVDYYIADPSSTLRAGVVEMTDYEPFGMQLANRHFVSGSAYRFGFNGKEGDDEWNGAGNMLNYGFRIHDPRLRRFLSVDLLAPDYPWYTPYQYAGNTPIQAIDLDGLEEFKVNSPFFTKVLREQLLEAFECNEVSKACQIASCLVTDFLNQWSGVSMPDPKSGTRLPKDYLRNKYGEKVFEKLSSDPAFYLLTGVELVIDEKYTGAFRPKEIILWDSRCTIAENVKRLKADLGILEELNDVPSMPKSTGNGSELDPNLDGSPLDFDKDVELEELEFDRYDTLDMRNWMKIADRKDQILFWVKKSTGKAEDTMKIPTHKEFMENK